ncbi:MAG: phosphoribosylamine--glycine ligase [Chitinivibrionales bacterium]|nr:phosphoribosylamine--glycine ligase [Chitinivibrionales bacterium]
MKAVLIVGSGGREHALQKALLRINRPLSLFAYPGNPGMVADGCQIVDSPIDGWLDLAEWARENKIDLTIVGPELPLVEGIVDIFNENGLTIFGPSTAAARIEGSKEFSKKLMEKYSIPTASFGVFTDHKAASEYCAKHGAPIVVKASGLAAGKGAIVCDTLQEAENALTRILDERTFGSAGDSVVLEEKMIGEEASIFILTDGTSYRILPPSQDHKPAGDNDTGPNTGGMGAYAPAAVVDQAVVEQIEKKIVQPTLDAMRGEGAPYTGLLYIGIMMTPDGPKVVEYNCRFGDPETQAVLPLIECDWYEVFSACARGTLSDVEWKIRPMNCVAVVVASRGYPSKYEKGKPIRGIEKAERGKSNIDVYHAGTALDKNGALVTSGGRVLAVSAWEDSLEKAVKNAYDGVGCIEFEGKMFRTDIGAKGLARLRNGKE